MGRLLREAEEEAVQAKSTIASQAEQLQLLGQQVQSLPYAADCTGLDQCLYGCALVICHMEPRVWSLEVAALQLWVAFACSFCWDHGESGGQYGMSI